MNGLLFRLPPARLRGALLAVLGAVVGALCVFGGIRLATQGAWGWGLIVALSGAMLLFRTGAIVVASRPPREGDGDGGNRSRRGPHTDAGDRPIE